MSSSAPILVFGFGNPSRGDDAIGPLLADRLEHWLHCEDIEAVAVRTDMQLNIEHVLDLIGRERVLFVDASASGPGPFRCTRVWAKDDASYTTHAVSPGALLSLCERVCETAPPRAELLAVPGERFELGEPLSAVATEHLDHAWTFLQAWCAEALTDVESHHA